MKTKAIAVSFSILLALGCCVSAWAQYAPEVLAVKGSPKIMKKTSGSWAVCSRNMTVDNGDRIRTLKDEAVDIGFVEDRKNVVRIGANSDAVVVSGQNPYSIDLLNGEAMALLASLPEDSNFEIKTPTGLSGARGTGWRSVTDGTVSEFGSYENVIYVKGIDRSGQPMEEELLVDMGYKTTVGQFERPERIERLTEADFERWNAWRAEMESRSMTESAYGDASAPAVVSGPSRTGQENKEKLDRIGKEEISTIEALEARKQDISESRDVERIEERQEQVEAISENERTSSSHSISVGP